MTIAAVDNRPQFVSKADREKHKIQDSKLKFSQDALSKSSQVHEISSNDAPVQIPISGRKRSRDESPRKSRKSSRDDRSFRISDSKKEEIHESREDIRRREEIREQFLNPGTTKKRVIPKPSDKMKFKFDWDSTEDTSRNAEPLFHLQRPLFGRGFIAGVDRNAHVKKSNSRSDVRSSRNLSEWTERDWHIFHEDHGLTVKFPPGLSVTPPRVVRNWEESGICKELMESIKTAKYESPTPIQMAAIPFGMAGYNIVGIAGTGTGKTAAFLIPILQSIILGEDRNIRLGQGPLALILAPTRDLAIQIEKEALQLIGKEEGISVALAVGGRSLESQTDHVADCHLMVATPGRLLDLMERRYTSLERVAVVVIDEADRMMEDNGLATDLEKALEAADVRRQTLMFSATMAQPVEKLARRHLTSGGATTVRITATVNSGGSAITERFVSLRESDKPSKLLDAVKSCRGTAIIFVNEKTTVNTVTNVLVKQGLPATGINGDMWQKDRERALDGFRQGAEGVRERNSKTDPVFRFLVATDVVARGIDVPGVEYVINYDTPLALATYLHRIGRTGRAGKHGTAITFVTAHDSDMVPKLRKHLEENKIKVPHELMERRDRH